MNTYDIKFELNIFSIPEKILDIKLKIITSNIKPLNLYKGNIEFLDFQCDCSFKEDDSYFIINPCNKNILISYKVKINTLTKHGFNGDILNDLIIFSGEQFLLLPQEFIVNDNLTLKSNKISINYNFSKELDFVIPFNKSNSTLCESPNWSDIYELMKSSYSFGKFNKLQTSYLNCKLNLFIPKNCGELSLDILNEFNLLLKFYSKLFNNASKSLNLILLINDVFPDIFGGCGKSIITFSFDENNCRHWQLLSHRIFHAFMDTIIPIKDFHVAPCLWITEGLATYYENISLDYLSDTFKSKLKVNSSKEFSRLFNRYLYMSLKDPINFCFPPMEEVNIKSKGKIEFLHYTKSPLIIKFIEDTYYSSNKKNIIISELLKLNCFTLNSLKNLFSNILGSDLDIFSDKYLFGLDLIPLWNLKANNTFTSLEILEDINYFEYVIYTWMALETPYYIQDEIQYNELSISSKIASKFNIHYNSSSIENKITEYCSILNDILTQHALRCKLCNLNYNDPYLRYKLLNDNYNLSTWQSFISTYTIHK